MFSGSIEPVAPVSADFVVALGGGITAGGEPQPATVARARRAAALYRPGLAQRIVMSGAYGMYDPPPPRAEATAMAEIAVAAGVPPGSVTAETRSRDTIGNIWFTKPLLGEPRRPARRRGDIWLACGARALPDPGDLGTRLPGGCGLADRRGEHAAA